MIGWGFRKHNNLGSTYRGRASSGVSSFKKGTENEGWNNETWANFELVWNLEGSDLTQKKRKEVIF